MKNICCTFLFLLIFSGCFAQYTVTKVTGNVNNKTSGEKIKPGSKLGDDDILEFSSENDMVRVIVAGKGIYVISPSSKAGKDDNAIVEILKYTLHLKSKQYNLSGRAANNEPVPEALETEAKINAHNLFASENKYLFKKFLYDVSGGSKFFLQIENPGAEPVIHQLKTKKDTLYLLASDFMQDNPDAVNKAKYTVGYFSKETSKSELLAELNPYFDTTGEMRTIIKLIIAANKGMEIAKLKQQCYTEVYTALGKPSNILFEDVFKEVMAVKKKNK